MTPRAAIQIRAACALGALFLLGPGTHPVYALGARLEPLFTVGGDTPAPGVFRGITGIGLLPDSTLVVVDGMTHTVQRYSAKGEHLATWGGAGQAEGRLAYPGALSVAPDGTVWVHDTGNNRLQHYLSDGTLLGTLALPGPFPAGWASASGEPLADPQAVAAASDGSLVVTYTRLGRIRLARYSNSNWHLDWGSGAYDEGVVALATVDDRVYVGQSVSLGVDRVGAVNVLDLVGRRVDRWEEGLQNPSGMAVGDGGDVFVADADAGRVMRFLPDGMRAQDEPDLAWSAEKVAARASGQLAFAGPDRLEVWATDGLRSAWGEPDTAPHEPSGVAVLAGGLLAVGDWATGAVRFITELGMPAGQAQTPIPLLIEMAGSGDTATALPGSAWSAWVVAPDARPIASRALPPSAGGYVGMDADTNGGLVLAAADHTIRRIDSHDASIATWTGAEHPIGAFEDPTDVARLTNGYAVAEGERVRVVNADGGFKAAWSIPGSATPGEWPRRWITGMPGGPTYVSDETVVYEAFGDGTPLPLPTLGGAWVSGLGSAADRLYVAEQWGRVWVLGPPDGPWVVRAYDNRWVAGPPRAAWTVDAIAYDWQNGPPADGLPADRFSLSAVRTVSMPGGATRFSLEADGGARLWVGDRLVIDAWGGSASGKTTVEVEGGPLQLTLGYNDPGGRAAVNLSWEVLAAQRMTVFLPRAAVSRGGQ